MKNRLKVLRAERDWTQTDLASALNVTRQTIHAIETEKYDPSLPLAFKISILFSLPIEQIFMPEGDWNKPVLICDSSFLGDHALNFLSFKTIA